MAPTRNYYAVAKGIYATWNLCKKQVDGFPGARYKKFPTESEAQAFIRQNSELQGTSKMITKQKSLHQNFTHCSETRTKTVDRNFKSIPGPILSSTKRNEEGYEVNENGMVVVYTDGACSNNQSRHRAAAGYGVFWGDGHSDNENGPVNGEQTNNRAEYLAIIRAIEKAKQNQLKSLCIRTDSQLIISSMTNYINGWRKNGWRTSTKEPVKNVDLVRQLDRLMKDVEVKFEKVLGHAGVHGNEMADQLAVEAAKKSAEFPESS